MPNAMRLIAGRLPRVTPDEVRRFVGTVEVRDAEAFAAELEVFMQEWLQRVELPASLEIALSRQAVEHALVVQAAALKADTRWTPGRTDIQRAREAMLEATHTRHAPWTLVDFNDQRLGRLTLIRHLLDHLPDTQVPEQTIEFPPLPGKPAQESFTGPLKPIPPFKLPKSAD